KLSVSSIGRSQTSRVKHFRLTRANRAQQRGRARAVAFSDQPLEDHLARNKAPRVKRFCRVHRRTPSRTALLDVPHTVGHPPDHEPLRDKRKRRDLSGAQPHEMIFVAPATAELLAETPAPVEDPAAHHNS